MSNSTRPSSSSSYDERFVVPLEASRRGAHRARVSPLMAILPVAAVVGIVVGAIALVYVFLGMGSKDASDVATSAAPSPTPSAPAAPSTAEASGGPSGSTTLSPGSVDKTIPLDVFNGTGTSGLAKKAGNKLVAAGWTTGRIETWTGAPVAQTTVYYAEAGQKASAQAVVKTLGRGTAKLSPSRAGTGMAVVIGPDYPGANAARTTGTSQRPAGSTRSSTRTVSGSTAPASAGTSSSAPSSGESSGAASPSASTTTEASSS